MSVGSVLPVLILSTLRTVGIAKRIILTPTKAYGKREERLREKRGEGKREERREGKREEECGESKKREGRETRG